MAVQLQNEKSEELKSLTLLDGSHTWVSTLMDKVNTHKDNPEIQAVNYIFGGMGLDILVCYAFLLLHDGHVCTQNMSSIMRKPTISICENKDAEQLRSDCEADQRLCFRYTGSTIPPLSKFKISCL